MKWKVTGILIAIVMISLIGISAIPLPPVYSQGETEVACGEERVRDFTENAEDHIYLIPMEPGESFNVSVRSFGDDLKTVIMIYGPTGVHIGTAEENFPPYGVAEVTAKPALSSGTLSAQGKYRIRVANTGIRNDELLINSNYYGSIGRYTLSIGCTLADGTKILPGENTPPTATPAPFPTPTPSAALPEATPPFDGIGFPGLAPVDMSGMERAALPATAQTYGVSPLGNEIYGFTVEAEAGDILNLEYGRESGDMNLGLVVLSENNDVFFQASLVTSDSLTTQLTLPEAGEYTIGLFRISLVEPAEPKLTIFWISGDVTSEE